MISTLKCSKDATKYTLLIRDTHIHHLQVSSFGTAFSCLHHYKWKKEFLVSQLKWRNLYFAEEHKYSSNLLWHALSQYIIKCKRNFTTMHHFTAFLSLSWHSSFPNKTVFCHFAFHSSRSCNLGKWNLGGVIKLGWQFCSKIIWFNATT